jgi:hypothetical protein
MQFKVADAAHYLMCGLSYGDTNQHYHEIDFAIYLTGAGEVYIYESDTPVGYFGTYNANDVFRVEVEDGWVKYKKGTTVLRSVHITPNFPLLVDTSFYLPGAIITEVVISGTGSGQPTPTPTPTPPPPGAENVVWANTAAANATGNTLTSTPAANGWGTSGGASTRAIASGDGYVQFNADGLSYLMCGLSYGDTDKSYQDIDFAIYLTGDGTVYIYEYGFMVVPTYVGTYLGNETFRVEVVGDHIRYSQGATVIRDVQRTINYPLLVDSAFYLPDAKIANAVISGNLTP